MQRYALVGKDLQHSISAFVHMELFRLRGVNAEYCLQPLSELDLKPLKKFDGYNVTFPYKESILPLLKTVEKQAQKLGAVNTVKDGVGYNTDIKGLERSLNLLLNGVEVKSALVLGCGGAGKVCCHCLSGRGMNVTVAVRDVNKTANFARSIQGAYKQPFSLIDIKDIKGEFDLLVNATPVGTYPKTDEIIVTPKNAKAKFLLDMVYNPTVTQLTDSFSSCGTKVLNGLTMLVWQAAEAQKLWLDVTFTGDEISFVVEQSKKHLLTTFQTETTSNCLT